MSTPSAQIHICSGVRLNNKYDHTIYFDNIEDQKTYFNRKIAKSFVAYTYLRKSWSIKVNDSMENAINWSYLFFDNGGKTYYYFITNVEYINDGTVELSLEIDVMQTYAFDYNLLSCFVEREHSATDNYGESLTEENVAIGEYITAKATQVDMKTMVVVIQTTANLRLIEIAPDEDASYEPMFNSVVNGVFGGCAYYLVELDTATKQEGLGTLLKTIDGNGKIDVILNMFMYPKALLNYEYNGDYITQPIKVTQSFEHSMVVNNTTIDGYTPKNKKLFNSPYNIYTISNHQGIMATLKPELFGNQFEPYFKIVGCALPDGATKCYPINYKGEQHNFDEGVTMGNFPMCAWNSDPYKLWVAQNQGQQMVSGISSGITAVAGATMMLTGLGAMVGAGMLLASATNIANIIAEDKSRDAQPVQSRGQQSSTVNVANGWQTFDICQKTITGEYARIIDDYFTMYGYKCSRVKTPNINARPSFNYVKTVGSNCCGDIPQHDLSKINEVFDKGITFWKKHVNIGDYSIYNQPI